MLKLKNLIENDAVAVKLLQHYEFHEVNYGFCRSSSNVIYWVQADGALYFLRYTTKDERTPEGILAELDFIQYLNEHGYHANQPVKTVEGEYLVQENGYLAVLFEGAKGSALDDLEITPEIARCWGNQLGMLHTLSKKYIPDTTPMNLLRPDYHQKFREITSILNDVKEYEIMEQAGQLEQLFDQIVKTEQNFGLCHYDFELDNVFLQESDHLFTVIDFDDSMYHFFAVDLMQVVMNIEEDIPPAAQNKVKEEFVRGYQEYMPMPDTVELDLARRFILLLGYVKLEYCLSYPPQQIPDWMGELMDKLEKAKQDRQQQIQAYQDERGSNHGSSKNKSKA